MGIADKMLNIMPYNCRYCKQGFYGMVHVSEEAIKQGIMLTELQKDQAVKAPVWDTLAREDPIFVNGVGHGNTWVYTGDSLSIIFTTTECDILAGRIVYLLSCLTAIELGPAIIKAGGVAYGGYNIPWAWMTENDQIDPYIEWHAEGFYRATNEFPIALIQGETVARARDRCIAEYNRWITIWETERTDDQYAADTIKWLIYDRDGLTVLGDLNALIRSIPPEKALLTVNSEPVTTSFLVDGVEKTTPYTKEIAGGVHVLKVPRIIERSDVFYAFRHWENGDTGNERHIWLDRDVTFTATYEQTTAHVLSVNSEPLSGLSFSVNGFSRNTPNSEIFEEHSYTIKFLKTVTANGVPYGFRHWEDGSTTPERTFNLTSDMALIAYYSPLERFNLKVGSFWCYEVPVSCEEVELSMYIDNYYHGVEVTIPNTLQLFEGIHVLNVFSNIYEKPIAGCAVRFARWEDGSVKREREINLTQNMEITAYYSLFLGRIFVYAKDGFGNDLSIPFTFDGAGYATPTYLRYMGFAAYTVVMPETIKIGEKTYEFMSWEDDSTNPTRTFVFSNMLEKRLTANYKEAGVPTHTLRVESPISVPVVHGGANVGVTPKTLVVSEGEHVVSVPDVMEA